MAGWGFGNAPVAGGSGEQAGAEIMGMDTPQLMFADEAVQPGDRLKLFDQPWPADSLPRPGASLLAIASQKKLLAAAGPDGLILTGTAALRSQYIPRRRTKNEKNGLAEDEPSLKKYDAEVKLQVPRLSHVAFSSDESCLVISAEQGGGLACYDVNALTNGSKEPAFQIATMGQQVRQLLPNPNPDAKFTGFVGIVLESGQLLLADLVTKGLIKGASGSEVFHENVQCASWSKLGKQIVAGLEDSTCVQIDFNGQVKDRIPQPPQLAMIKQTGNDGFYAPNLAFPASTIYWLETHKFLIIYTPQANQPEDPQPNHNSVYFIAQREKKDQPFTFHQFQDDPCMASMEPKRFPASHYIQRLHAWQPALQDMLIITSSAGADIGTLASFKDQNGEFILANLDETRKASLPMSYIDGSEDTSAIGMAMDFSAIECAPRPIPEESDTIEDSPFPLPALCILNTDGVLQMWWTIYAHSVKQTELGGPVPYPAIVNKDPPYINYTQYQPDEEENAADMNPAYAQAAQQEAAKKAEQKQQRDNLLAAQSPFGAGIQKAMTTSGGGASRPTTSNGPLTLGGPTNTPAPGASLFGGGSTATFGGAGQLGQKVSPWGTAPAKTPTLGQSPFSQQPASPFGAKPPATMFGGQPGQAGPSTLGGQAGTGTSLSGGSAGQNSTSAFGKQSTPGNSLFGAPSKPSTPGSTTAPGTAFGKPSQIGGGTGFGQQGTLGSKPSIWGAPSANAPKTGADSPFAAFTNNANKASPFATAGNQTVSPWATTGKTDGQSPFSGVGQGGSLGFGKTPALSNDKSMGSTATLGSTPFSSFEKVESGSGSSLSNFKLGSGFKGDGSAKDDLPRPKDPGGNMFGNNFLGGTEEKKPAAPLPVIKPEPGTAKETSLNDIPEKKDFPTQKKAVPDDAPLPPDPISNPGKYKMPDDMPLPPDFTAKNDKVPDDAPLPPDFTTTKSKVPDDMPLPPDFTTTKPKKEVSDDDVPIAGSPPINVTNSQTFSGPSEGPSDDGSGFEDEEGDEDEEESGEEDEEDGEDEGSDVDSEGSWEPTEDDAAAAKSFADSVNNRATPPAKKAEKPSGLAKEASYTPLGLPNGPSFPPPQNRPILSPRSPSPHRAVTSPVANQNFKPLPSQIKSTSIPPAKPVERPAPAPKAPQPPTEGELEDQAADRVKDTLSKPPVPSKQLPAFYTHQDYAGSVDKPGVGGQIEIVYRDVNSMVDVLGLNARSLEEFLQGHEQLRKPGRRTREDLEEDDVWCLGDVGEIAAITDNISTQLKDGQLEGVPALLAGLEEQQKAIMQLRNKTTEMRKLLTLRTDPERLAMQAAAPLSAELQAQQAELRNGVQAVQGLLTEAENKLALLRADLAAATKSSGEAQKGPVPTVEAVTKTILKMTAMVEQKSGDVDLLESQIRKLPNGIVSLRLADEYEDDLVSAMGSSKLLTTGSPARATPRRPRMAANGDPLGMSGMFGTSHSGGLRGSRFQTPPSASLRRSVAFTPDASGFGRSTVSMSGSARKKMVDVTVEEVEAFQTRKERRKVVFEELRKGVLGGSN